MTNPFIEISTWLAAIKIALDVFKNKKRIIIRKTAIGDILWTEPIIRALASTGENLIFLNGAPELFENYPFQNVQFIDKTNKPYKRAIRILKRFKQTQFLLDLDDSYENAPKQHLLYAYQHTSSLPKESLLPNLYLSEAEKIRFKQPAPYVVLHIEFVATNWNHRQVYGIDWQIIINQLNQLGYVVYLISKDKMNYENVINQKTSLRDLIALIYNATFFIGLDSAPANIAAVFNVPEIVFFGSVNPWFRRFPNKFNGIIMQQHCEFSGCFHRAQNAVKDYTCLLENSPSALQCCQFSTNELSYQIDLLSTKIKEGLASS